MDDTSRQTQQQRRRRTVIATHLILTLYGHWGANDPRGSGSTKLADSKFAPLGPIHRGRKPGHQQPSRSELRTYHAEHESLLNFPVLWIDGAMRAEIASAVEHTIHQQRYTCYACAICANHLHPVIRTHRDRAQTMWRHFADGIRTRLRLRLTDRISPHHPVISSRPYNVLLYTLDDVRRCITYVGQNPIREHLAVQHWSFITEYDNWPFHKK